MKKRFKNIINIIRKRIKSIYYYGNSHYCVICKNNLRLLKTLGRKHIIYQELEVVEAGFRRKRCPVCNSSDKERQLFMFLERFLQTKDYVLNVLHIAPELPLYNYLKFHPKINYTPGDFFTAGYDYPEDVLNINIENTPFNDESFDLIICSHVLEHVSDDTKAVQEMNRILKNNHYAIIQVPLSYKINKTFEFTEFESNSLRNYLFGQEDHLRLYGKNFFKMLEDANFLVNLIDVDNKERNGISANQKVIFCQKRG